MTSVKARISWGVGEVPVGETHLGLPTLHPAGGLGVGHPKANFQQLKYKIHPVGGHPRLTVRPAGGWLPTWHRVGKPRQFLDIPY
jgi:hypothetical protein